MKIHGNKLDLFLPFSAPYLVTFLLDIFQEIDDNLDICELQNSMSQYNMERMRKAIIC